MKQINQKELGNRIKTIREKANLTQHDVYEKTGISTTQISAYENGKRSVGLYTIAKIANALNTTIDYIYCGSSEMKPIYSATSKGELIVNCVSALFDEGVVAALMREKDDEYVPMGMGFYYKIGFKSFLGILNDMVLKLDDFEKNRENYPDPEGFKNQILASAAKQINDSIKNNK